MTTARRMGLNAVIFGIGSHGAARRMPETDAFAWTDMSYWIDIVLRAENGGFDAFSFRTCWPCSTVPIGISPMP